MQWTGLNELREKYLSFFESKGHLRLQSFPLIPRDDNSLLLINSGMAPMKKYFTGEVTPPRKRVTTCQKCIRTPDIERVGITARHGTFFEMLGNFSFGDYFKHEATAWAWEFCTKVLELPIDKIWVSIYENDDEAYDIWTKEVGVSPDRIVRLGKEDNFWEHGEGPCGPCSELYFDRGEKYGCGKPTCGVGCDCDRFVEFWNNVFTQFESDGKGNYTPLDHPNIDTGMGLERLACIMQGVDNLFLVDTVQNIMKKISELVGVGYGESEKTDISLRVITDHIRSTTFMIGDGVMPSNEGRGYVLRRLLRRAARHGRLLGVTEPFMYKVVDTVIHENPAYPELAEKRELIVKVIRTEEESFRKTLDQGFTILNDIIERSDVNRISGEDAFKLNDTYGFPIDLIKEVSEERGMIVDLECFNRLLKEQKERAKNARKNAGADAWLSDAVDFSGIEKTKFVGYTDLKADAKILAIVKDGEKVEFGGTGDDAVVVLDTTPFYAESGGQVGDVGIITTDHAKLIVRDTVKDHNGIYMHRCEIAEGTIEVGDSVKAEVDEKTRYSTMRNHTAAHLLQAALRKVLGNHVEQAGQLVTPDKLRFDFTHFSALTDDEIIEVEKLVNEEIFKDVDVATREMPIDEAKKLGAMALFGEKYGDIVRVVMVDDFSKEFCGGTHIENTAKIGLFRILNESSVASGVRRIEAVTGEGVLHLLNECTKAISDSMHLLKSTNMSEFVNVCKNTVNELKEREREINRLTEKLSALSVDNLFANAPVKKGVRIVSGAFNSTNSAMLKTMTDRVLEVAPKCVAVLFGIDNGKGTIAVACGKEAQAKGAHAGKIVKQVAEIVEGKGGGKPERAMAGVGNPEKIDTALLKVEDIILSMIKE
ncbi:MAG: alanine--tRNA ligase [Clostridia bacterium]|nr:alanine--tRNA ligase [Clostridia bacterium]